MNMEEVLRNWASVIATIVTAVATIYLWKVTKLLAAETKRMVDAAAQPQVVASIEPNQWTLLHADLSLENTGNATAFDIQAVFDPPLPQGQARAHRAAPLQSVSVLKPGQKVSSYVGEIGPIMECDFLVKVSWLRSPIESTREELSYRLNLGYAKNASRLGASSPLHQLAEELKGLRADWSRISKGGQRLPVDVFTAADRSLAEKKWRDMREAEHTAPPLEAAKIESQGTRSENGSADGDPSRAERK
jgi:hypothetical protein